MTAVCVCVPMSAMAEPAQLSGREIGEMLPGATIQIDAPFGYKLPVRFGADGTLAGEAGGLASYLGSATDTGRWWLRGDYACYKWSRWLDGQPQCMRLAKEGRVLHWTAQDGNSGTATLIAAAPARQPVATASPQQVATAYAAPRMIATLQPQRPSETAAIAETNLPAATPHAAPAPVPAQRVAAVTSLPDPAAADASASAARTLASPAMTAPRTAPTAQQAQTSFVVTNVRENDVLNVRSGPSTEYDVVAALKPGSRGVAITGDCRSEWCPVRHQDGAGWVNSQFLASEGLPVVQASLRVPAKETLPPPPLPAATPAKTPFTAYRGSPDAPRTCLTAAARALLQAIETKFGPVKVVSTCRAGATIAGTGRPSRHASGNAVDFSAGARKGEILRWLIATHKAGGVMTYPDMDHIHVDIGPHFVSIAGGQRSASWRGDRGSRGSDEQDSDD